MELLVERDITRLVYTNGRSFMESDAPEFLKRPMCIVPEDVDKLPYHSNYNDLLIPNNKGGFFIDCMLNSVHEKKVGRLCGLWSGYRSAIVRDTNTKKIYKLKGVSLNPETPLPVSVGDGFRIAGGQKYANAHYEMDMLSRFNKTLENEGINPVITPIGTWKYPNLCKDSRPTASIFEIKGDTRLDELVFTIEGLMLRKMSISKKDYVSYKQEEDFFTGMPTKYWVEFEKTASRFFSQVGFAVGRLLNLMHKSGQSWSSISPDEQHLSSNSHWGNVVLYRENYDIRVGLVDFDVSCCKKDLSRSEMESVQKQDVSRFNSSLSSSRPISMRKMRAKPFRKKKYLVTCGGMRNSLRNSFANGYGVNWSGHCKNKVHSDYFMKLTNQLRSDYKFSFANNDLEGYLNYYLDELTQVKTDSKDHVQFSDELTTKIYESLKKYEEEL